MNELTVNNVSLFFSFGLFLISVLISQKEKLTLSKDILLSILRAVIQLTIVGYVLKYLFQVNNVVLTALMSFFIVVNAAWKAHKRNHHPIKSYWNS